MEYYDINFNEIIGKVFKSVENKDDEEIIFTATDGTVYKLYHDQDCCESVTVEDICGDLNDIIGEPIIMGEEVVSEHGVNPEGVPLMEYQDSFTWTFYKIGTIKGVVTIRWYGDSNGYYSESVEFARVEGTP